MTKVIQIPLTQGKFALIDKEDFDLVAQFKWHARKSGGKTFYATCRAKRIHMHRLIMGITDKSIEVDHRNRNGLDNTKVNLRIATHAQNMCNKGSYKGRSSEFKGVYWNKEKKKWTCQITKPGEKTKHVGHFRTEIEAAQAYNKMATQMHGEFAYLNQTIPIV